jgi:hypothetical protein
MWLAMQRPGVCALRADALFVSALQRSDDPGTGQVQDAIAAALHEFGGQGCAEQVAQEFGDHPETAVVRMRWARVLAEACQAAPRGALASVPGHAPGRPDRAAARPPGGLRDPARRPRRRSPAHAR